MSRTCWDTFALIVNFIDECWMPCHMTVELFDAQDISRAFLAKIVMPSLHELKLIDKIVACIKEKGSKLAMLELTL